MMLFVEYMYRTGMGNRCFDHISRIHMRNIEPKSGYFFGDSFQVLDFLSIHNILVRKCHLMYIFLDVIYSIHV